MAEQYRDERRAKVSDCVDVISAFRSLQPGHEVIDVAQELIDGATGEGP